MGRQAGDGDRAAPTDRFIEIGPGRGAITCRSRRASTAAGGRGRSRSRRGARGARRCRTSRSSPRTCSTSDLVDSRVRELTPAPATATSASSATCRTTSRRRSCFACSTRRQRAGFLRRDADAAGRGRRPAGRQPGTGEYGVLTFCTALGADVTRAAVAAAGRVSSGAQGAIGGRPTDLSPAAARDSRSRARRGHGPVGLHAAPQDAVERAGAVCDGARHRAPRTCWHAPASTRAAGPKRWIWLKFGRLADELPSQGAMRRHCRIATMSPFRPASTILIHVPPVL